MIQHNLIDSRIFDLPKDKTVLWTVNSEEDFKRYMEMDIYGIVTDIPDTMQLYRK
jgi:glycerophosphoryl diester phosphodiesterase